MVAICNAANYDWQPMNFALCDLRNLTTWNKGDVLSLRRLLVLRVRGWFCLTHRKKFAMGARAAEEECS